MEILGLPLGSRKQPCPRHLYVFTLKDPLHPSQLSCAKADSTTLTPQIRDWKPVDRKRTADCLGLTGAQRFFCLVLPTSMYQGKYVSALFTWDCSLLRASVRPSLLWNSAEVGVMLRRARKWRSGRFPGDVREYLTTATWGRKGFPDSGAAFTVREGRWWKGGAGFTVGKAQQWKRLWVYLLTEDKECWHSAGFLFLRFIQSESLAYRWSNQIEDDSSSVKPFWNRWFFSKTGQLTSPRPAKYFNKC